MTRRAGGFVTATGRSRFAAAIFLNRAGLWRGLIVGAALLVAGMMPVRADTAAQPPSTVFLGHLLPGLDSMARALQAMNDQSTTADSASLPARRAALEQQAKQAFDDRDWAKAAALYRARLGLGDQDRPALWLALATSLSRTQSAPQAAVAATAYIAYQQNLTKGGDPALAKNALMLLAGALQAQGNDLARTQLLAAIQRAYPNDPVVAADLKAALTKAGIKVSKLTVNANQFPTDTCIAFNIKLSDATDFHPGDWVTFAPKVPNAAVTTRDGALCIDGLPAGHTTKVILRAGLPLQGGAAIAAATIIPVAIGDRTPQLIADVSHYLIPASAAPAIGISTVNLNAVRLKIVRVAERSLNGFFANHPLFNPTANQSSLGGDYGKIVWQGQASVAGFVTNSLVHTTIDLPKVMAKPGLYAIQISPTADQPNGDDLDTVQLVLRTNMAPIVWRGWDGLHVQIRQFTDAEPLAGSTVNLIAGDNAILASAKTDATGIATFAGPELAGDGGQAPAALHITGPDGDFTVFDLTGSPIDLSDRGISGRPVPDRIDPYLWLDRGIYRPGETVHVSALYRSDLGIPLDLPLHVIIRRPGGQVYLDKVVPRSDDASVTVPVALPDAAQAGNWVVSLAMGVKKPDLATRAFTVAAFVPAKLKVSLGQPKPIASGTVAHWPVDVRFLYGAPGSKLSGTATLQLMADATPFDAWKDYRFGLHNEILDASQQNIAVPDTGPDGKTLVPIDLTSPPDTTHALKASLTVSIDDPSGRAVTSAITLPITPARPLIGIKEGFGDGSIGNGIAPAFDLVAVDPSGKSVPMTVNVSLVRQDTEWHIYMKGNIARWAMTHINHPVETKTITLTAGQPTRFTAPVLDWGQYRLRVVQAGGGFAASSVVFYSGWASAADPAVPQQLKVLSGQKDYAVGDTATLHVSAPFQGPATLVIASDHVLSMRNFTLPKDGTTLKVTVARNWGPGAYAIVEAFQKPDATHRPERAVGLTWVGVAPGARKIDVQIPVAKLYRPGRDITFDVHAAPGAYVTLAGVDEGILQLTDFPNPDPVGHFFGQRQLGVSLMDDYAALMLPPSGQAAVLKNGAGGDFGSAVKPIPQRIVSLFAGPVQAGPDGIAKITLHVPQFNGQVRLMAVAWTNTAVGAANADIIVRNRVIADALLPRFLAPGDTADAGLMLQNLDLPDGQFTMHLHASGALSMTGKGDVTLDLKPGDRQTLRLGLAAAKMEGSGRLDLDLTGPAYTLKRDWTMTVHSARAPVSRLVQARVKPGESQRIGLYADGLYPGSIQSTITFGNMLPFDPAEYMQALAADSYPFLAQSVSRGLPLTVLKGAVAGKQPEARLARAVQQVLDLQRYDGAFGLWSSHDDAEPWLTAYATEFLLRARKAGAYIPEAQIDQAEAWLTNEVAQGNNSKVAQIYASYVLGLSGNPPAGAIRLLGQSRASLHMPLTLAQLGAAENAIGEGDRARTTLDTALAIHNRMTGNWWLLDQDWVGAYGTPLRDAWAVPAVVAETGLLGERLPTLAAELPGKGIDIASLNAQELAWACFADGVLDPPTPPMDFSLDGQAIKTSAAFSQALPAPASIANHAATPLAISVATTGVPDQAPPATQQGMIVERQFYTQAGVPLDPSTLDQNAQFVMVIAGRAVDSAPHRAVVDAGLPAGWELAGNISGGKTGPLGWLGPLSQPQVAAAADDRYEAAFDLAPHGSNFFGDDNGVDREFRVAVLVRATTQGHFTLPGVSLSDMFHPTIFGRTTGGTVTVLAPGAKIPIAAKPAQASLQQELAAANTALGARYRALMQTLPADRQAALHKSETAWIEHKRTICGHSADAMKTDKGMACLLDATRARLATLQSLDGNKP